MLYITTAATTAACAATAITTLYNNNNMPVHHGPAAGRAAKLSRGRRTEPHRFVIINRIDS